MIPYYSRFPELQDQRRAAIPIGEPSRVLRPTQAEQGNSYIPSLEYLSIDPRRLESSCCTRRCTQQTGRRKKLVSGKLYLLVLFLNIELRTVAMLNEHFEKLCWAYFIWPSSFVWAHVSCFCKCWSLSLRSLLQYCYWMARVDDV